MKIDHITKPLLEVNNLSVSFRRYCRGMSQHQLEVISDLSVQVRPGEVLAIAGSSGSGKSLLAHAIMGLLPSNAHVTGQVLYGGQALTPQRQQKLRGSEIALIPQSVNYLDPLMKVGEQVRGADKSPQRAQGQRSAFSRLGLCEKSEGLYPFQLSGGMARRVLFSTAVITDAQLIIADEPTPGMHIDQALEALSILRELADGGKAVVLITHDIDLALRFADRIAVFYAGTTVEEAPVADFLSGPDALRHPYSKALWRALPQNEFAPLPGIQPYAGALPSGCLFAPRCSQKMPRCEETRPPMCPVRGGFVRCNHDT